MKKNTHHEYKDPILKVIITVANISKALPSICFTKRAIEEQALYEKHYCFQKDT